MQNDNLTTRLETAVKENIPPGQIAEFVCTPPTVITTSENGRMMLNSADILPDEERGDMAINFANAKEVAYWVVDDKGEFVKIVGLMWLDNSEMKIFHGLIGPP